jgi:hypothetical protein
VCDSTYLSGILWYQYMYYCNNDTVYDIFYRKTLSSEHNLACILLYFIDETHMSCINTALNIYSSSWCFHPLNHNHDINMYLCVIQFQFFCVPNSIHDSTQCGIRTQPNNENARRQHAPKHVLFVSKMFLSRVQLRTHFVETNTPYMHCQSTARKTKPKLRTFTSYLFRFQYSNHTSFMMRIDCQYDAQIIK